MTVNNDPPILRFNWIIINDQLYTILKNFSTVEFISNNSWIFTFTIENNFLKDTVLFEVYNNTEGIIYSNTNLSPILNASRFLYYSASPYKIRIFANDTDGLFAQINISFYVNDTINPNIVSLIPSMLFNNNTIVTKGESLFFRILFKDSALYEAKVQLYDEALNLIYSNNVTFNDTINEYIFEHNYTNTNTSDNYLYGFVTATDGHTEKDIKEKLKSDIKIKGNTISTSSFSFVSVNSLSTNLTFLSDRVMPLIKYDPKNIDDKIIHITPKPKTRHNIVNSEAYGKYLIINNYWIDFLTSDKSQTYTIKFIENDDGTGYYEVVFKTPKAEISLNSIGIINTYTRSFKINYVEPKPLNSHYFLTFELNSTPNSIIFGVLAFLWVAMIYFSVSTGNLLFMICAVIIGIILGIILSSVSPTLMLMMFFINALFMVVGFIPRDD
jgi:small nuclear ribonucleoprotein (snRNP)-like protein